MRALEFTAEHLARVVDAPAPSPTPGEVLVAVTSAGVCGSDVTALKGVHPFRVPPLITGHEGGGAVVAVGEGVDDAWRGRVVALEPQRACGRCGPCTETPEPLPHLCRDRLMLGMPAWPGTLAEYVTAPLACLYPVDGSVPDGLLALAEPLAVAEHAVRRGPDPRDREVAVLGGGPIGALLVHLAVAGGAAGVLATDPRRLARDTCARLGAVVVDPTTAGAFDGRSGTLDVVYVATTAPGVLDQAIALLRPRGTVVEVGLFGGRVEFDVVGLQQDEKTLTGSTVYTAADFAAAVAALERSWRDLAGLVTDGGGLDGVVGHLTDAVAGRPSDVIKLLVRPDGSPVATTPGSPDA
ncbi:alcohol dehydrogenase catalytic domain-containing protein [Actinomycetospora endophytica]|uniref:Alcohol dehydrogenase catalytic domain-containing protein n=1 Tax=Actinomycetospora endophytica TaxID=2291215 RepID=A0ABS8P1I7_9PSEU|nr:alcohol dehydrogenase catalytic domain-containing protein [Actinomycetospora endophytica]MCD2191923.1 alcohol dehydrogenase catalytic domain-containing protein [Actinomycetospora endophytica]